MTTTKTIDATQTFWDIVAIKDSIDGIMYTLREDHEAPFESMARVDLHNAKVELNKALAKLRILIEANY
jgi:hypothetical protein